MNGDRRFDASSDDPDAFGDRGREAVYAAELAAFGGTDLEEQQSLAALLRLAAAVVEGGWWRRAGGPQVKVMAARSAAHSSSARDTGVVAVIRLAAGQVDTVTLIHELAHALAGIGCGHNSLFRSAHVDVAAVLAGAGPAARLAEAYRSGGLFVEPRPWSPPVRAVGETFVIVP